MNDFSRGEPSQDQFAELVIREVQRGGWPCEIGYDSDRFAVVLGDEFGTFFLQNLHKEWFQAGDAAKQAVVARAVDFARELAAKKSTQADAMGTLLPVIRNLSYLRNQWLEPSLKAEKDEIDCALKEFCGALAVSIAEDRPNSISIFSTRRLREWSRTLDDLLPIAIDNLRAISPSKFRQLEQGFFVSDYNDNYDSSRLLLPELFAHLTVPGEPVAVAVSRSCLAVSGSRDCDALEAMAKFVESEVERDHRSTSYLPLVLRDGSWRPFDFPEGNVPPLSRLRIKQYLRDYGEQKIHLDRHFDRTGRDVFVATLKGIKHADRCYTWTTWTPTAVSLLPEADAIIVGRRSGEESLTRSWGDVIKHCGPLQPEPGTYPTCYLVEQGPDNESWERLAACSEPDWFLRLSTK